MNAIKILTALTKELEITYPKTGDFENWITGNNNVEVMIGGVVYCIDYSITGKRDVKAKLSIMKPETVEGRKTWFKCGVDCDLKQFIESSICQVLPILFDELLDSEIAKANEELAAIEDEMKMCETYQSLTNYR